MGSTSCCTVHKNAAGQAAAKAATPQVLPEVTFCKGLAQREGSIRNKNRPWPGPANLSIASRWATKTPKPSLQTVVSTGLESVSALP